MRRLFNQNRIGDAPSSSDSETPLFTNSLSAAPLPTASSWEMLLVYLKRRRYLRVINESMIPTLYPGDVVVLNEAAYRHYLPQTNDIVVAIHPNPAEPKIIKRVQSVTDDSHFFLVSDNASLPDSRDSRTYGAFSLDSIVGKITSKLSNRT